MRDARRREEALHPDGQPGHRRRTASARASSCIRSGVLGPVKEIHVWTNRPIWPQGIGRPKDTPGHPQPRPLGRVPRPRPRPAVPPGLPPVQLARLAGLRHRRPGRHGLPHDQHRLPWPSSCSTPRAVEVVDTSGIVDHETYPVWSIIRTQFGPRNGRGPLTLTWYDGGDKLPEDKRAYKEHAPRREGPRQRPAAGRREGLVLLRERLRRRARPAAAATSSRTSRSPSRPCRARPATSPSGSRRSRPSDPNKAAVELRLRRPADRDRPAGRRRAQGRHARSSGTPRRMKAKNSPDADQYIRRDYRKGFSIH